MSGRGLRAAMLWMGAVGLPVVLSVVSYILTSDSLDASTGRLPVEQLSVAQSDEPPLSSDARPTAERKNRIAPSAAGADGSDEGGSETSHEFQEHGSVESEEPTGPDAGDPLGSEEPDDHWNDEEEVGGDD